MAMNTRPAPSAGKDPVRETQEHGQSYQLCAHADLDWPASSLYLIMIDTGSLGLHAYTYIMQMCQHMNVCDKHPFR